MPEDRINDFSSDDVEMNAAIEAARNSIGTFIDAFVYPTNTQKSFLLKVAFSHERGYEHIWMADLKMLDGIFHGTVANEPKSVGLQFMARATFQPSQVTDWMFIDEGFLVGGFTTKLIRDRMNPEKRSQYDAGAPYKFR